MSCRRALWFCLVLCASGLLLALPAAPVPPAGKPVTLTGPSVQLSKALKSLGEQSGVPVVSELGPDSDPVLKLDLRNVTFWQALDGIAKSANARPSLYRGDGRVGLAARVGVGKVLEQPVSYDDIFRVALQRLTAINDFENGRRGYTVVLEVAWEPHFLAYFLETAPQNLVLRDEAGKAVPLDASGSRWERIDAAAATVEFNLPALPPATPGRRRADAIGLLKCALAVRGTPRLLSFEFATLDKLKAEKKPVSQTKEGVAVSVGPVKLSQRHWTVQVTTVLPPGGVRFESNQFWDVKNQIYLLHRDGKTRLVSTDYFRETVGSSRRAVVNYHFTDTPNRKRGNPADWRVVYRAPAGFVEVPIPFEFKDVPLPP